MPAWTLRRWIIGIAVAMALCAPIPTFAQTYTWNVTNGSFQNPSNWTPLGGPPGVGFGVTANFQGVNSLSNFLATFDSDWGVFNLQVNQGSTTFGLNGHTMSVTNLFIGTNNSQTTTLNLNNGTFLAVGNDALATGTSAVLTLNLNNATFAANGYIDLAGGTGSTVNLNIRNASTYSPVGNSFIGITGTANVLVDGVGSSFNLGPNSRLGDGSGSSGAVTVQNGAAFNTMGPFTIGAQTGATGTVNVSGPGSTWTHRDSVIALGGGANGTLNINPGGTFNVTGVATAAGVSLNSNSSMNVAGTVNISGVGQSGITLNAGVLSISTGGTLTTDYFTRVTGSSLGLNDGSLIINKQFNWNTAPFNISGIGGGDPVVQLQNGATTSGLAAVTLG